MVDLPLGNLSSGKLLSTIRGKRQVGGVGVGGWVEAADNGIGG